MNAYCALGDYNLKAYLIECLLLLFFIKKNNKIDLFIFFNMTNLKNKKIIYNFIYFFFSIMNNNLKKRYRFIYIFKKMNLNLNKIHPLN